MSRRKKDPLRPLTDEELAALTSSAAPRPRPPPRSPGPPCSSPSPRDATTSRPPSRRPQGPATPSPTWSPASTPRAWPPSTRATAAVGAPTYDRGRPGPHPPRGPPPAHARGRRHRHLVARDACRRPSARPPTACPGSPPTPSGGCSTRPAASPPEEPHLVPHRHRAPQAQGGPVVVTDPDAAPKKS